MQKLTIIGNVGQDAQVLTTHAGGVPFVSFSVGCNESFTGADGVKQQKTTWYNVAYKYANAAQYIKKGTKVYIEGSPRFATYTDKQGQPQIDLKISARTLELLDSNKE